MRKVELVSYGVPAVAISLLGLPLYIYLPTFYAQDVGLGVFVVGVVLFFARLFDMLIDPLIGYMSPRLRSELFAFAALRPGMLHVEPSQHGQ